MDETEVDITSEEIERAKAVDLIVIPKGISERCSNCMWIDDQGHCWHPEVDFLITEPELKCCGRWDTTDVDRTLTQGDGERKET